MVTTELSWQDAQTNCRSSEGYLAEVTSQEEQTALAAEARRLGVMPWVGLTDRANENTWVWDYSRVEANFTAWDDGEPNDATGEDCVLLTWYEDDLWNDYPCEIAKPSICESKP